MAKRVLLIEDEPNIIEAISFILSRDGWTVHTHADGRGRQLSDSVDSDLI
jgi:DNA-binding response OmpR family regulator